MIYLFEDIRSNRLTICVVPRGIPSWLCVLAAWIIPDRRCSNSGWLQRSPSIWLGKTSELFAFRFRGIVSRLCHPFQFSLSKIQVDPKNGSKFSGTESASFLSVFSRYTRLGVLGHNLLLLLPRHFTHYIHTSVLFSAGGTAYLNPKPQSETPRNPESEKGVEHCNQTLTTTTTVVPLAPRSVRFPTCWITSIHNLNV